MTINEAHFFISMLINMKKRFCVFFKTAMHEATVVLPIRPPLIPLKEICAGGIPFLFHLSQDKVVLLVSEAT